MDIAAYRREGEAFVEELALEHYLHFAGRKDSLEVEPVYAAHASLFTPAAVDALRSAGRGALLQFCVEGLVGRATAADVAEIAHREARLELELEDGPVPMRRAPIEQANEPDAARRAAIERARLEATERELDPLHGRVLERSHELADELGWASMTSMCADVSGIELGTLATHAEEVLEATDEHYVQVVAPQMREEVGVRELARSDLAAFFRAPSLDEHFPERSLVTTLADTIGALGVDAWQRVTLDAEARPTKSPRAFCAPVRVPDEVYLVIAPHGGRDDYETILHEAGHAQHYAHVDPSVEFERRHLGDNSVTEAYAFLLQRLAAEPGWLQRRLGVSEPGAIVRHARAAKLVLLRRYAAKLGYELELHDAPADPRALRSSYARRLTQALELEWPEATWLSDIDPFFYAARYLRAWALEAELAAELAREHGADWFDRPETGARLVELWSEGQPRSAAELLGREPDFSALIAELTAV